MSHSVWLRDGRVYIPTEVVGQSGIRYSEPPVDCIPACDTSRICAAVKQRITAGIKTIPDPPLEEHKRRTNETIRAFGFKSWSTLSRGARLWGIYKQPEGYKITPYRKVRGGFQPDLENATVLPLDTPVDEVCARVVAIVQQAVPSKP